MIALIFHLIGTALLELRIIARQPPVKADYNSALRPAWYRIMAGETAGQNLGAQRKGRPDVQFDNAPYRLERRKCIDAGWADV